MQCPVGGHSQVQDWSFQYEPVHVRVLVMSALSGHVDGHSYMHLSKFQCGAEQVISVGDGPDGVQISFQKHVPEHEAGSVHLAHSDVTSVRSYGMQNPYGPVDESSGLVKSPDPLYQLHPLTQLDS